RRFRPWFIMRRYRSFNTRNPLSRVAKSDSHAFCPVHRHREEVRTAHNGYSGRQNYMRSTLSRMTNIALPVAATTTKISSTAEEQKEDDDNQEQIHGKLPL